ncbi:MAG: hypothetical protein JXX14_25445 [Deltaproteobacteria bacterium]|nr:hypothetical protein [Deltaproteobacteria bacterium]
MKKLSLILLSTTMLSILITGCAEDNDNDTASTPANVNLTQPYGAPLVNECLKLSACGEGTVDECLYNFLGNDDGYSIESIITKQMFQTRQSCIAAANDCDAVSACISQSEADLLKRTPEKKCQGYPEDRCENDQFIWCLGYDGESATEPTQLVFDLSLMNKTCNSAGTYAADPTHTKCNAINFPYGKRCNGAMVEECVDGQLMSYDCRHVDAAFTCTMREGDQALCSLPDISAQCADLTTDLYTTGSQCTGNTAQMCISGKYIEADCRTFGATCQTDDYGVYCTLP